MPSSTRRTPQGIQPGDSEAIARDLPRPMPLEDALKLVHPYAEKESPKYEKAAMKFLRRYLDETSPTLKNFANVVRSLDERRLA